MQKQNWWRGEGGGKRYRYIIYLKGKLHYNLCVNNVHNGHFTCMVEDKVQKSAHPTKVGPLFNALFCTALMPHVKRDALCTIVIFKSFFCLFYSIKY